MEAEYGAVSYLKHCGFFKFIGIPVGKSPNEAPGGATYQPICEITRRSIDIPGKTGPFQEEIDRRSDKLAEVIYPRNISQGPAMMISYCLREIIRNVFEHSGASSCFVIAQRWYTGEAEIVIADEGIGIQRSLSKVLGGISSRDALEKAIFPGVTSGLDRATGSRWDNSGFGLFVTSELGKRYGSFTIASSNALLSMDGANRTSASIAIPSTIVKLHVNTIDADYFPNILREIVEKGEMIAGEESGLVVSASKASKMYDIDDV
ncbi:hypothetical protein [Denitromonas sp.]|uniref:hypothetical protein n=1 Tax=Denitromonas sp. TaxID=2734609 RepID=UPI003A836BD6